ncbi:hypothetical protein MUK70_11895 [Dyadobacter chenwenxiniae]|uniref:Uncharacterized protein n=1 Tax=Dyadobacter chenwenxiniae TaxID=2906456 RepID=A0A9X1PH79_9BACT|nr:hypothetical protein [Dyadobacter chenwenxiniae]MCF0059944.1 hypothetical protein [Dyadobacter chenwenxiniae]UON85683.1 hypothetical protein MUK70_11895 [Dyadobacter chenwenxiniae]
MEILSALFPPPAHVIIQRIHDELDTASDRLLKEANDILSSFPDTSKAERLSNVGFAQSLPVVATRPLWDKVHEAKAKADLLRYYIQTYPFQKFLTEQEMERICKKYNLIFAPVSHYKMDVPEKNLLDIERAQVLKEEDKAQDVHYARVKSFMMDVSIRKRIALRGWHKKNTKYRVSDDFFGSVLKSKGIDHEGYVFLSAEEKTVYKQGLFIAAPRSEFNLKGLSQDSKFGWMDITKREIKDPIVFEYCRGGMVRVITKWGLEASDEALVNPVEN